MGKQLSTDVKKKIGAKIRDWRIQQGLTQQQLASKLKCSWSIISKWEQGKQAPSYVLLKENIKKVTGVDVDEIVESELSNGGERASEEQ